MYQILLRLKLFKIKFSQLKHKKIIFIAGILLLILIIFLCHLLFSEKEKYYYIDYNGIRGAAKYCSATKEGLYCEKLDGGTILVKEYWMVLPE